MNPNTFKFISCSAVFGAIGSSWYYRPIADPKIDGSGGDRSGPFISNINLHDYADKKPPLLYSAYQKVSVACTVSFNRFYLNCLGNFTIIDDENYHNFVKRNVHRDEGVSLITVANHRSTLDDPAILSAILPYWMNIMPKYLRWNVCAQEYCFNSKIPSLIHAYIGAGKTLPMWRGGGVNQKHLLDFCRHVAAGDWCHIFPEAGVWQTTELGGRNEENAKKKGGKLKWGVGKMIAHAPKTPIVIPFFHHGMETIMPVGKTPLPRPGKTVSVRFGPELYFDDLIDEHEKKYGKIWKYTSNVDNDGLDENSKVKQDELVELALLNCKIDSNNSNNDKVININKIDKEIENNFDTINHKYDINSDRNSFHKHWDSRPNDYKLYQKITLRIENALELLNHENNIALGNIKEK